MSRQGMTCSRIGPRIPGPFVIVLLAAAAGAQEQPLSPSSPLTRDEQEAFLLKANVVGEARLPLGTRRAWRVELDDGRRQHAASVETSRSADPSQRDYRSNIAAYELDKALELHFVAPSVERSVNGQPAAFTWWVDDVLMSEVERRRKNVEPPDHERWNMQMQAVRVFDELTANAYRDVSPALYTSTVWDNLLITRRWRIELIDHTRTFASARQLEHPESLERCDRTLLARLRELNGDALRSRLGRFLAAEQLDALETRRALIVGHFDERIARQGEAVVLYDLPPRPR